MKPTEIEAWAATRAKGMLRFVLLAGVLAWGIPMFVLMTFFVNDDRATPMGIAISAAIWGIAGALFGVTLWFLAERRYRNATASKVE